MLVLAKALAILAATALGLLLVLAVVGIIVSTRDSRRLERARRAGLTARERLDLERKLAETRERIDVRVVILPVGENSYRWIAWDDSPMYPEQVDGVLVPYGAGMAPSYEEAEADARVNVFRRLEGRGHVVRIELEPEPRNDQDSPS